MTVEVYERWLPVVGWEGWYEVSCRGRVRSIDRWVDHVGDDRRRFFRGRILKQVRSGPGYAAGGGYLAVHLARPGVKAVWPKVHILVLTAFAGAPEPGQECRHGPGGQHDNRWPENLRWGTHVENMADKQRDGTITRGEHHPAAKLTEADVQAIRRRHASGESQHSLATAFGVCVQTVNFAVHRKTWRHVT